MIFIALFSACLIFVIFTRLELKSIILIFITINILILDFM